MEFELGQTYSGYKFLDVVGRSRSVVQYRVQNTLAQRVEGLRTLTSAAGDDPDASNVSCAKCASAPASPPAHCHVLHRAADRRADGDDHGTAGFALSGGAPATGPAALGGSDRHHAPVPGRALPAFTSSHSFIATSLRRIFCSVPTVSASWRNFPSPVRWAQRTRPDSGAVVGNPRYISPEQVKGERSLDQRSDLYSLGVVLYEMLCGRPPFESRSQFELMMAHVNLAPAPPSSIRANLPGFLDAVVLKALAKDAEDRYPTASAFADALGGPNAEVAGVEGATAPTIAIAADVPEVVAVPVTEAAEAVAVVAEVAEAEPGAVVVAGESAIAEVVPEVVAVVAEAVKRSR